MTRRRKKAGTIIVTLSAEDSTRLAAECCPLHDVHIADGLKLEPRSRLWRRRDGSWTARFIYKGELGSSVTTVVRGIVFQ